MKAAIKMRATGYFNGLAHCFTTMWQQRLLAQTGKYEDIKAVRLIRDLQLISNMKVRLKDTFNNYYFTHILLEKHLYRHSHKFLTVTEKM